VGHVDLGALRHVQPIDRQFGFSRGWPVHRYYIEAFLKRHNKDIRGRVLEVKDPSYTRRFGGSEVTRADVIDIVETNPMATIIADLTDQTALPAAAFDCVILTQTLHLIYDIQAAIQSVHRALRPGGVLLLTVPGITKVDSGCPQFWSFTTSSARRVVEEFFLPDLVEVQSHGNKLAAIGFLEGLAVSEFLPEELDAQDVEFPICITVRAVKPAVGTTE
jgi:SAM-dependent methyltransferase